MKAKAATPPPIDNPIVNRFFDHVPADFHARLLPGEPHFTLMARDPDFARLVLKWAAHREKMIECGARPASDRAQVLSAREIAAKGQEWRRAHRKVSPSK